MKASAYVLGTAPLALDKETILAIQKMNHVPRIDEDLSKKMRKPNRRKGKLGKTRKFRSAA